MQVGSTLEFSCVRCQEKISFSVFCERGDLECSCCGRTYTFSDAILEDLRSFEGLCRHIHAAKNILGQAFVAVDVDGKEVRIPYKLLLTRFTSVLELQIPAEEKKIQLAFRLEPIEEIGKRAST